MNREKAKELLPIIQAFAEGKQIQDKIEGVTDWVDTDEINFEYEGQEIKHRIKPEPKYRPFKTQEECWKEIHKHPDFGWIRNTVTNNISQVLRISDNVVDILSYSIITRTFEFAFQSFKFTDGKPFGIKEE